MVAIGWLLIINAESMMVGCCGFRHDPAYDVVIYGSSPAALTAAITARRLGKTAVIVSPETRIGGLTTGGLGQTDIGNKAAFGGLALQFYKDVADYYKDEANWKWQKRTDYLPDGQCAGSKGTDSMWTFEPSAALKILEGWEKKNGLEIHRGKRLDRSKGKVKVDEVEVEGLGLQRNSSYIFSSLKMYGFASAARPIMMATTPVFASAAALSAFVTEPFPVTGILARPTTSLSKSRCVGPPCICEV